MFKFVDGVKEGKGVYQFANGDKYEGEFSNDNRNGFILNMLIINKGYGIMRIDGDRESYEGDWVRGEKHGRGTYKFNNGDQYSGQWENSMRYGRGTYTWFTGDTYTGEWKDDKMTGFGKVTTLAGKVLEGKFDDDALI